MKIYRFEVPAKGEVIAEIEAETKEEAIAILKSGDWYSHDHYCFDPDSSKAVLTNTFNIE